MHCVACFLEKGKEMVAEWTVEGAMLCKPCFKALASVADAGILPARTVSLAVTITQAPDS